MVSVDHTALKNGHFDGVENCARLWHVSSFPDKTDLTNMVGCLYFYDQGFLPPAWKDLMVHEAKLLSIKESYVREDFDQEPDEARCRSSQYVGL